MQVRKFEAPTMQEVIKIVKQELGPDAIILSTKNNKKGFGLLSKASVEVTAAITEKNLVKKQITEKVVTEHTKDQIRNLPASKQSKIYDKFSDHYHNKAKVLQEKREIGNRYIDIRDESLSPADLIQNSSPVPTQTSYGRNAKVHEEIDNIIQNYEQKINYSESNRGEIAAENNSATFDRDTEKSNTLTSLNNPLHSIRNGCQSLSIYSW